MLTSKQRPSSAAGGAGKKAAAVKKRAPLANITNRRDAGSSAPASSLISRKILGPCAAKGANTEPPSIARDGSFSGNASLGSESNACVAAKNTSFVKKDRATLRAASCPAQKSVEVEFLPPLGADALLGNGIADGLFGGSEGSISACETMFMGESLETPEFVSADDQDSLSTESTGRSSITSLHISEKEETPGNIGNTDSLLGREMIDENKLKNPRLCVAMACEICEHLRLSEVSKRPYTDFIERIQTDIDASMRAVLVDWLVEVSEEFGLVSETLFLSVNYIDRYLSGNPVSRQRLQLLGVTCMMIAAKYEEVFAPDVEEFCHITDNTYCKEEVLQMESHILSHLKFEMTAPTANCFLRWYIWAAHEFKKAPTVQLECLLNYIAELSLLDYSMLCYAPSMIAASTVFLAKFMLSPSKKPWNSALVHYTLYHPSDLCECVRALHHLCRSRCEPNVTAVRRKYSHHKYKFVAKKYCLPSIPEEFFED